MTWPTPYVPPELRDTPEQIAARRAVLEELKPCRRRQRRALAADWARTRNEWETERHA